MRNVLSAVRQSLAARGSVASLAAYGALLGACVWTLTANELARAEDDAMGMPDTSMAKKGKAADKDALARELRALRKQVSDLRTVVQRQQASAKPMKPRKSSDAMAAMPRGSDAPVMGSAPAMSMDDDMDMMGAMPRAKPAGGNPSGGMAMDSGEMGAMGGAPAAQGTGSNSGAMSGPRSAASTMAMEDDTDSMGSPNPGSAGGMAMDDDSEMGGMGSGGTSMQSSGITGGGMKAMGCCMGSMGGMGSAARPTTSLPGFPGRSHLYHIGAEGFFLNHPQHIALSVDQQARLNRIREQALLTNATYERRAAEAEQALFVLTGADLPDTVRIHEQLRVIADLRAEQRAAFIRGVGEAAEVLTDSQRDALLGRKPAS